MTHKELQQWLGAHGQPVVVDGKPGPATRAAIWSAFTNPCAPAITPGEIRAIAARLGCSEKQVRAVAKVESGGSAFDQNGRPKMLFERHLFHRLTGGVHSVKNFSNPKPGGYDEPSWNKLLYAACQDADAAFASASWGKFQVLGSHAAQLGYASSIDLAYSTVTGEGAHYELLARYVERFGLLDAIRALSTDPRDNRDFARRYNGPQFARFKYDEKLAEAMAA